LGQKCARICAGVSRPTGIIALQANTEAEMCKYRVDAIKWHV
jgi:hypothetical protein